MTPRDRDPGKRCQPVFPEQADVSDLLPKKIRSVVGSFQQGPVRQHGIRGAGYADSHRRLCHAFDAFNHTVSSHLREVCLERSKTFVDAALHCFSERDSLFSKWAYKTGSEMRGAFCQSSRGRPSQPRRSELRCRSLKQPFPPVSTGDSPAVQLNRRSHRTIVSTPVLSPHPILSHVNNNPCIVVSNSDSLL